MKRLGLGRFDRGTASNRQHPDRDAYLLVLLADQELSAGRLEQARSLLNAAYSAFDCQSGDLPGLTATRR